MLCCLFLLLDLGMLSCPSLILTPQQQQQQILKSLYHPFNLYSIDCQKSLHIIISKLIVLYSNNHSPHHYMSPSTHVYRVPRNIPTLFFPESSSVSTLYTIHTTIMKWMAWMRTKF